MTEVERQETVIYGGAFNPPTRAHQTILQACVDYAEPRNADVWLLPSASRTDKVIEANRSQRLAFCQALTRDVIQRTVTLGVETTELDRPSLTETYDTVKELEARYPERQFTWVFGADSVATMESWDHGDWLRKNLSMLVIARPGSALPDLEDHLTQLEIDAGEYSSTELRRRLAHNEPFEEVVSPQVFELLTSNR